MSANTSAKPSGSNHRTIGPELGIGNFVGDFTDGTVLILKSCIGNLASGWDLPPPGSDKFVYTGSCCMCVSVRCSRGGECRHGLCGLMFAARVCLGAPSGRTTFALSMQWAYIVSSIGRYIGPLRPRGCLCARAWRFCCPCFVGWLSRTVPLPFSSVPFVVVLFVQVYPSMRLVARCYVTYLLDFHNSALIRPLEELLH